MFIGIDLITNKGINDISNSTVHVPSNTYIVACMPCLRGEIRMQRMRALHARCQFSVDKGRMHATYMYVLLLHAFYKYCMYTIPTGVLDA